MANSHEPSYYEIALTNRQVVVAFVILLICLLCAFFSGVYIGREGTLRDQEQLVRTTPPAQPPANDEGRELDEFEFFDSANNRATAPDQQAQLPPASEPAPSSASADTTLLEDFGGEEEVAPAPEEDAEEAEAPQAETPTERRIRQRREREARRAAAAAEALSKPTAPAEPAREEAPARTRRPEPAAAPASSTKGKVVIQVFSSAEKDQAERIRQRLVNGGHPAFLSPVEVGGTTMYRVRIGPYASRGDAQKVADSVRKGYKLDTWITE